MRDLSYGELSQTQADALATLAFSMSAEICAKRAKQRAKSYADHAPDDRAQLADYLGNEIEHAIRALASEEG
jgi:hypothetical protein